jgi:SulP family sulfate permease
VIRNVFPAAVTIALLAGIESLLSAAVADGMIGGRHRSNMELIAQGVANLASPLFGGIPATGAIARTATNIKNGGRTPVAGIVHALVLLLIMLCFGTWAALIPLPCLAAILVVVAYNMSEWHSFRLVLRCPRSDVIVLLTTFALTVLVDLTAAIQVGMVLSVFLFVRRMSEVTNISILGGLAEADEEDGDEALDDPEAVSRADLPSGVELYEIKGLFFFGAAYKFREAMHVIDDAPKVRIIQMRHVLAIDATGIQVLRDGLRSAKQHHIGFILTGVQAQPLKALERVGLVAEIGEENVAKTMEAALQRARDYLSET